MRERLVELLDVIIQPGVKTLGDIANYLIANGVIVLPFKIGETLYDIGEFYEGADSPEIYELKSNHITIEEIDKQCFVISYDGAYIHSDDIGKTILHTREEAEQVLKGGEE